MVPVYNVENYLPRCIDSALAQTLEDIEIICVDDCSTDGFGGRLGEYKYYDMDQVIAAALSAAEKELSIR